MLCTGHREVQFDLSRLRVLGRVGQQVDRDLLQLQPVRRHCGQRRIEFRAQGQPLGFDCRTRGRDEFIVKLARLHLFQRERRGIAEYD